MSEDANDEFKSLCAAVGFIVIQWAQSEQTLDMIVNLMFNNFGGKEKADRNEIPRGLKRKVKFIRHCLAHTPELTDFQNVGNVLMDKFTQLSKKRHDYVHGAITGISHGTGNFGFIKLDAQGDIHVLTEFVFNPGDFPILTRNLLDLGAEANALCRGLIHKIELREGRP